MNGCDARISWRDLIHWRTGKRWRREREREMTMMLSQSCRRPEDLSWKDLSWEGHLEAGIQHIGCRLAFAGHGTPPAL